MGTCTWAVTVCALVVAVVFACSKKAVPPAPAAAGDRRLRGAQLASPAASPVALNTVESAGVVLPERFNTEAYDHIDENRFRRVDADPLSTFSIDVDTASYANVRRFLNDGPLPPAGAVRIEELINYFRYDYPQPTGDAAVRDHHRGRRVPVEPEASARARSACRGARSPTTRAGRRATWCSCIDVSGSMMPPDKLPLVRSGDADARRQLTRATTAWRSSSTPARAGSCCRRRPATSKATIHRAIAELEAGGSTNGGAGHPARLRRRARATSSRGGVNRVDPRHRRRLQRRRHQPGRARAADRRGARERRVPVACSASARAT